MNRRKRTRTLVLILGDQLCETSAAFDGFDDSRDAVWMAEVREESTRLPSHKARIALFLSAMRHFRDALRRSGKTVDYHVLDDPSNRGDFASELREAVIRLKPERLVVVEPGEWRVKQDLVQTATRLGLDLDVRHDRHFICSREDFAEHLKGRKRLLMEFFYRTMRRKTGILMEEDQPVGGKWNYDAENRQRFDGEGPAGVPKPTSFKPDDTTLNVIALVQKKFSNHPGSLEHFDWPVTARQAKRALNDFVKSRLPCFGSFQDAMWTGEPYLFHSRLSSSLNLKLLDPRDAIESVETAYHRGNAPLNSVEGFIRQVVGWREYVRGIYWHYMPGYIELNELDTHVPLPWFYWTAETDMNCMKECIGQTLRYGFAHHIQRLMTTGLFALLLGVEPRQVHEWYLAIYVDAVEWVEMPNTIGMSQFADGGLMATKPYVASGAYIKRMSNYCNACRYHPSKSVGQDACPFTTLYWDFLMRHEGRLRRNARMTMQLRNLKRLEKAEARAIRRRAETLRNEFTRYSEPKRDV